MAGISITIDGLDEAQGLLGAVQDKIKDGIRKGLAEAGEIVVKDAKAECPVDTGELQGSIKKRVEDNTCTAFASAAHGMYVEFGTRYQRAQPFMVPALIDNEDAIRQIIADAVTGDL